MSEESGATRPAADGSEGTPPAADGSDETLAADRSEGTPAADRTPATPPADPRPVPAAVTPKGTGKKSRKKPAGPAAQNPAAQTPAAQTPAAPTATSRLGAESLTERPLELTGQALPEPSEPVPVTTLRAEDCTPASERELLRLMRDWRQGRATRKLSQVVSDAYVVVFGVLMVTAMAVNVVLQAQTTMSQCSSATCTSARLLLPYATVLLGAALALSMARLFGPVLASAAEGSWLMSAPIGRARLLRGRLVAAVAIAAGVGAVLGVLITLLSGTAMPEVAAWTASTALVAAGVVAWAAAEQGADHRAPTRWASRVLSVAGLGVFVLVIALAAGWTTIDLAGTARMEIAAAVGAFGLLVLVAALVVALARLNRIPRLRLMNGGSLAKGLSGAFYALDLGLIHDIVVERRATERGHVRAMRGSGSGLSALVLREVQRTLRSPAAVPAVLATVVVPYAADALGMATVAPFLGGLVVFVTLIPLTGGLRVLTRNGGLARTLPFSTGQLRLATIAVPAAVAAVWAIAASAAFMGFGDGALTRSPLEAALVSTITAAAGLMGAVRWTTAKTINWNAPMASTPAGAVPPGLILAPIRGIDMVLLITAPVLLGVSPIWSLVLLAIVAFVLLGGFNVEAARAQQEQQRRELEKARAARR